MTTPLPYDIGFQHGADAAHHAITAFLARSGHPEISDLVRKAWADNTLVQPVEPPVPAIVTDPTFAGPALLTREQAKTQGFTGNQCANCNSMKMQVSGHCECCADCGTTTGCS